MTYEVYILKSLKTSRYYIGYSNDPVERLKEHNGGKVRSTKGYRPWQIVHSEIFSNKALARKRELEIKSYKSGQAFKKIISDPVRRVG